MSAVQRRGQHKPYVGCCNWGSGADPGYGYPKAYVFFRGHDEYFDTWREAVEYASAFGKKVQQIERAS